MNTEQELDPNALEAAKQSANVEHFPERSLIVEVAIRSYLAALPSPDEQAEVVGVPAATIIAMRDALLAGELNEAYHQLYTIADPEFCQMEPWRNIEHKASLASPPAVAAGGVTEARVERLHTELCRSWQTEAWISGPPIDTIRRVLTAALAVD